MRRAWWLLGLLVFSSCAGWGRGCSSWTAENMGADWIVVQYRSDGHPINCWKLNDTSVANESNSDGVYWKQDSHLIHISGWYNRVQVFNNDFTQAAKLMGIDLERCVNGRYKLAINSNDGHGDESLAETIDSVGGLVDKTFKNIKEWEKDDVKSKEQFDFHDELGKTIRDQQKKAIEELRSYP